MTETSVNLNATAENGGSRSQQRDGSTACHELKLTPREELAVINQRLKSHCDDCKDERAKALLEIAADCVRSAIHRR